MSSAAGIFPAAGEALLFLLYALCSCACAFFRLLVNTDELWNFAFGENIAWGLLPYRDFNYLQTPFSALVNGLLFQVFGGHILVMRLAGALLFTVMAWLLYRSGKVLGAEKLFASLPGFALILIFSSNIFFEYAGFCLCTLLLLLYMDLRAGAVMQDEPEADGPRPAGIGAGDPADTRAEREMAGRGGQILAGVLGGLAILSKQTYGAFIAAASWIAAFMLAKSRGKGWKEAAEAALLRMTGSAIPCLVFLFYLLGTGTFGDFWEMCFLGIRTFSARYRYTSMMLENPGYFIAGMAFPAALAAGAVFTAVRIRMGWREGGSRLSVPAGQGDCAGERPQERTKETAQTGDICRRDCLRRSALQMGLILLYTVFGCINMVPLANLYHFETCVIPAMLIPVLLMAAVKQQGSRVWKFLRAAAGLGIAAVLVFLMGYNPVYMARHFSLHRDIPAFAYTYISRELADEIDQVSAFITKEREQGHEVYVLDNCAGYYLRPLGIYHKYLDMFLLGNLGLKDPLACLEDTLSPGSVYLMPDESRENTQYPKAAVQEFQKELIPDGKLASYEVYRAAGLSP